MPAALFFGFWVHLLHSGMVLKESAKMPVTSERFIVAISHAMDDPWNQNSALRLFFRRLSEEGVSKQVWAGSLPYGWALWHQMQADESLEIMLIIAHQSGNLREEERWVKLYSSLHPHSKRAHDLERHVGSSQGDHEPLLPNMR